MTESDAVIGSRYRVLRKLGGGGMAVVLEVFDTSSGRTLALKRPRADPNPTRRKKTEELFALEFHTLSQLAHPRIVANTPDDRTLLEALVSREFCGAEGAVQVVDGLGRFKP